ncbi:MAG: hypothetical protein HY892_07090 [Deltaproteobacteria bacterium]|nr:hypothetical protein [Deltaproteobacteria bacterium]
MLTWLRAALGRLFALAFITILCAGEGFGQSEGTFPKDPFNGLQVTYKIAGANVSKFADVPGFTWTRTLTITGFEGSGDLTISGKLTADWGYYADVVVGVSAGGKTESKTYKIEPNKPQTFAVRVPIPKNAKTGGVSIVMTGHYNAGTRGVVVRGSWDTHGQTTPPADPDQNRGPQSPVARMKEILRRYQAAMPVGIAATGPINNLWADNTGDPRYKECACGGYQSKILTLLGQLQYSSNPKEKALFEGYGPEGFEYGPIAGWMGGHQAVVLYPKGTDWRVTGTVLDPWPTQNHAGTPITYPVAEWAKKFPPLEKSGETRNPWARLEYYTGKYFSDAYPNPYDPPKIPEEVTIWMQKQPEGLRNTLKSITDRHERYLRTMNEYKNHKNTATLKAHCPLNVYLMDGRGRISGFPGGVARLEIPEVLINTLRLADGTYWTELNYPRNTDYKVIFEGTGNGPATVYTGFNLKADARERRIYKYDLKVASGQKYSLDQKDENAQLRASSPSSPLPAPELDPTLQSSGTQKSQPVEILNTMNINAVYNGPTRSTTFVTDRPVLVTHILTYHWNNARGKAPGAIGLRAETGKMYGPWGAKGSPGQGGVPDANWEVFPKVVIPAGTYTVIDSDPATWAQNSASGGRGMCFVKGASGL